MNHWKKFEWYLNDLCIIRHMWIVKIIQDNSYLNENEWNDDFDHENISHSFKDLKNEFCIYNLCNEIIF